MAVNLNIQTANSWGYEVNSSICATSGRLYTWDAAMTACPAGWRMPTRQEWDVLVIAAGGTSGSSATGAENLKSQSWDSGKDTLGFSALPCGFRSNSGIFSGLGSLGYWWSATEYDASIAYNRYMGTGYAYVTESNDRKDNGLAVRCVQN
jgi:uncharacterized protein (TIGR02145 family)